MKNNDQEVVFLLGLCFYMFFYIYQNDWEVIKEDLERVFKELFERGILDSTLNETFVCFILKMDRANKVKDFRPISLITSTYKIIAKVLANRLKKVLPSTILEAQGAFVTGWQILDQALIANEAIEDYRGRGREGIIFKIEFEKADDHVDWGFLDKVLEKKGFGYKWRSWIWSCVRTGLDSH